MQLMSSLSEDLRALWSLRRLVGVLTRREFEARNAGSVGGIVWAWLPPLLTVFAYYLVFDVVFSMRLGEHAPTSRVGAYLIVGMLPWMAFADATQRGMSSLLDAGGMLQKNPLPPAIFPARSVLASSLVFSPLILLLIPIYTPAHHFSWGVVAVFPLYALQLLLCFLLGYLLAVLAAALRDVVQVVGFLLSIGIFLSPVLFPATMFPEPWRWVLWLNPMSALVMGYQSALLQGAWPPIEIWGVIAIWLVGLTLVLNMALSRSRDQLVDWL
ncbi:lipopolysaccharide transport system permease protein [Ottowia thiooxydans]|uniref:Transport permease protein n=2 Tax=Ottowia thiooxydans TaxID=219182 RepID=A0ABV2QFZ9_9BURK